MEDPDLIGLLRRVDAVLTEVRAVIAASLPVPPPKGNGLDAGDDFAAEHLLDTSSASARFNRPRDTVALWCRQGDGRKIGGRWMASVPRIRRRLNRE